MKDSTVSVRTQDGQVRHVRTITVAAAVVVVVVVAYSGWRFSRSRCDRRGRHVKV